MKKLIAATSILSLALTSCGPYAYVQKSPDYEYRYEHAKAAYAQGKYKQASELLMDLIATYRGTQYAEESLYMLSMSEYLGKDYEAAASYFKKYYQTYPKGKYVEHARYYYGHSLYLQTPDPRLDQSSTTEAISAFQEFLDFYPYTSLRSQAEEIIYSLQDKLVEKEYLAAKLYYDLGDYVLNCTYGGSNFEACVVTAENALKDYPYARPERREELSLLILKAKYHLARNSVESMKIDRFRDTIDEYYAFTNDYPESKHTKEVNQIFKEAEQIVKQAGVSED